ncbi:MAG: hypothetical protein GHCLOJNM_02572 [bacterium]|nr:hypothetical protein [bacterium]
MPLAPAPPEMDLEILTVAVYPRLGGMTSWIDQVAHGLARLGWRVRLIGISDDFSSVYDNAPFETIHLPMVSPERDRFGPLSRLARWREAHRMLLKWCKDQPKPRLRLSDSTPGVLQTTRRLSQDDQVPWAVLAGGDIFSETKGAPLSPLLHSRLRSHLNAAKSIFVDGPDLRESLGRSGIARDKLHVLYHGVSEEAFSVSSDPPEFFSHDSGPRLAWHGRHVEDAGPFRFLEILKRIPDAQGLLAGDGPLRPEILERIQPFGNRCAWVGPLPPPDLGRFLAEGQFGVYPLRNMAGVPRVLLESMAAGLVTLTLETGACRELIRHGENGLVCRDESDMAATLEGLHRNPEARRSIGLAARETIRSRWSEEASIRATARAFEELLGASGLRGRQP